MIIMLEIWRGCTLLGLKKITLKGWKFRKKMHMNLTVPVGKIRCVFYDKNSNKKIVIQS